MPPDFDPLPELNWPRLSTIQELLIDDGDAVRFSFVDDQTLEMLRLFLRERRLPGTVPTRPKGSEIYGAIEDAVRIVAKTYDIPEAIAFNSIHLAAHNLDDAHWDLRRHGAPQTKNVGAIDA